MQGKKELLASVTALYGPASKEVGEMIADNVRLWRWKRAHKILQKAVEFRRLNPTEASIPLKFFLPFIEEASKEDDEELSLWWARLLSHSSEATVGFDLVCVDILKSLGRAEAEFLLEMSKYRSPELHDLYWNHPNILEKLEGYEGELQELETRNVIEAAEMGLPSERFAQFLEQELKIMVVRTYYKGAVDWDRTKLSKSNRRSFEALLRVNLVEVITFDLYDTRAQFEYARVTPLGKEFLGRVMTI